MQAADTILAISSSVGAAPRMIVRLAGPQAKAILEANLSIAAATISPRTATPIRLRLRDNTFPAIAFSFPGPNSYTGDDLLELHIPGSPILAQELLQLFIAQGGRLAEPGEFTARAYLNGRMDLSKAEGVSAVIGAQNDTELRAARQLLAGELARRLHPLMDDLAQGLALLEAGIDFVEEDISFISRQELSDRIDRVSAGLKDLLDNSSRFERLPHQPRFVLVGRPNAGKSTLLNALAGHERAVVSPVAGTTRDALSAIVTLKRGEVALIDVAGLEDHSPDESTARGSMREIEAQMQKAARRELMQADYVLHIAPADEPLELLPLHRPADLVVRSKADCAPGGHAGRSVSIAAAPFDADTVRPAAILVSAVTGEGLEELKIRLDQLAFDRGSSQSLLTLNARHVQAVEEAQLALDRARAEARESGSELIALDLREALNALGRILGEVSADDLLGRIFSTFCIGK